jgi:hypothetical protein
LNPKEVAVSKLCCPACWDFFDVLSEKHRQPEGPKMYNIRGRHSTVYPVQLPNWSSPDVVKKLIGRYNNYLCNELDTMLNNHKNEHKIFRSSNHTRNPSLQSVSSAITNISQDSADTNVDAFDKPVFDIDDRKG